MPHSEDFEDYGDLDDSALIHAATQAETLDDSEDDFEPSPRPAKRRRTTEHQLDATVNGKNRETHARPRNQGRARRRTIVSDDEDTSDSAPFATTNPPEEDSLEEEDAFDPAPLATGTKAASRSMRNKQKNSTRNTSESASPAKKSTTKAKHRVHMPAQTTNLKDAFYTQAPPPSSCPWMIRGPIWQKKPMPMPNQTGADGVSPKNHEKSMMPSPSLSDEDEAFDPPPFPVQRDGFIINSRNSTPGLAPNRVPTQP